MLWVSKGEDRVRALEDRVTALQNELADATARHGALSASFEDAGQKSRAQEQRYDDLSNSLERIDQALKVSTAIMAQQTDALALQGALVETLAEASEQHQRTIEQLRADLARTQRQAAVDMTEMRETNSAVVASVLLKRGDQPR